MWSKSRAEFLLKRGADGSLSQSPRQNNAIWLRRLRQEKSQKIMKPDHNSEKGFNSPKVFLLIYHDRQSMACFVLQNQLKMVTYFHYQASVLRSIAVELVVITKKIYRSIYSNQ